jgi:predicted phosphodiesterase
MNTIMLKVFLSGALYFILLGLSCPAHGAASGWKFVVMGDTRDKTTLTSTGISPDLSKMAEAIAAEKPDLVIHTGDLINGYYTAKDSEMHGRFIEMFRKWKAAVKPIYDYETKKGIPIYPVRGNHEDGELITNPELKKAYEEEFAAFLPQNGPEYEKGLTYSVAHKGARFIGLDEYSDKKAVVVRGYINQPWLDRELERDEQSFVFVFCHTPAYQVGNYHQSPFPNLYSHPNERETLWMGFKKAGVSAYFCGHIHFYCRGTIDGIPQIVIGNGGADTVVFDARMVDKAVKMEYPKVPYMNAADIHTGYVVITVDESTGSAVGTQKVMDPETGKWRIGDTFLLKAAKQLTPARTKLE